MKKSTVFEKATKAAELHEHIEEFLNKEYGPGYRAVFQTACITITEEFEKFSRTPAVPLFELTLASICLRNKEEILGPEEVRIIEKYTQAISDESLLNDSQALQEVAGVIQKVVHNIGRNDLLSLTRGTKTSLQEAQEMAVTYLENL